MMNRIDISRRGAVLPSILLTMVALLVAGSIVFAATPADATDDRVTVTTYEELKNALNDGLNVGLGTDTFVEGDAQFIKQGQYIYLESGAKYKGTVTYNQNSIIFGGKDGSEVKTSDYIIAQTDCYITAGEPLEIKGTFRGEDNQENRFIKITGGSIKATGGIVCIRLDVHKDSTLVIESEMYQIDSNSLLDIRGNVIANGEIYNRGSIDVDTTGKFDIKGTLVNLRSANIDNEGTITVDVDGTVSNEKYGDNAPTITNRGSLINDGTISIMFGTLDVSAGSTQNNKILTIGGTIIGDDANPVKNGARIELNGESNSLRIENIKDGAEVDIKSVLCKALTISNSIGEADTSDSTIRIEAEHFALEGLGVVSKIRDSARYNDMNGGASVTDQKSPLDHNTDRERIECASIHADGCVSIDGELSLPKGVTLRVGHNNDHTVFTIGGTFVTDAGQITADVYKDESMTDTESVTGLYEAGGLYLKNTEITITGKYTAKAIPLCNNRGNVFNFASYAIDGVSNYTSLSKAIDECSKSGRDCQIWSHYEVAIDDDMLIPDNITLNALKSVTVKERKTLTVNGKLMLTSGMVDGEIATNRNSMDKVIINGGGSVTVSDGAELTAKKIVIFGSLTSSGSVVAEHVFVGTSDEILRPHPATLGAISSVSGQISATGYWVVATDYDVSGVNLEGCVSTSYVVEDAPYVTLYAVSPTCIGIVTATDQEDNKWIGWYAEGRSMTDVSNDSVGDHDTVCAMYENDIVSDDGITAKDCLMVVLVAIVAVTAIALIARTIRN